MPWRTETPEGQAQMVARLGRATLSAYFLACFYCLFFHHLGDRDLWSSHEARAAQNAQGILESGHWLLPRLFDGRVEMQKPPLYYWLVALAARLQDGHVDGWAVRLPASSAALIGMAGILFLAWRRGRPVAGMAAALILGTMIHYTWMGRVGRIDMPLTAAVCLGLTAFYLAGRALRHRGRRPARGLLLLGYVAAAVAFLLKGPIGLVLIGLVIVCHLVPKLLFAKALARNAVSLVRGARSGAWGPGLLANRLGIWWGIPLFLALVLPWFLYANQQTHGEFFREFFWRHNLQRGLGGDMEMDGHDHPFWFYLAYLWVDTMPWSALLPFAGWYILRRKRWRKDAEALFGGVWFVTMLIFLSAMQYKRADYLLPAYPGLALFLGCVVERWWRAAQSSRRKGLKFSVFDLRSLLATAGAFAAGWLVYVDLVLPRLEPSRELRHFASEVRKRVPQPGQILGFRVDSHQLAFHLGLPFERLWEWENLDIWACQPAPVYVVMPADCAAAWSRFLEAGKLYPVVSTADLAGESHDHPLVLLCTRP